MLELSYSYHDRHSQIEVHYSGNKKIIAVVQMLCILSLHAAPVIPVRLLIPVVHQSDPVCLKSDFSGYLCDQAAADLSLTYQLDKCFSLYPLLFQTGFAARTTAEVFN